MADLHDQLLRMARKHSLYKSPDDATVRRAVSTAYYALFHAITYEATLMFDASRMGESHILRRVYSHSTMKTCCGQFSKPWLNDTIAAKVGKPGNAGYLVPMDVRVIAKAFVDLQQLRHDADYNHAASLTATEAATAVQLATDGILKLSSARQGFPSDLGVFLLAMLLGSQRGDAG